LTVKLKICWVGKTKEVAVEALTNEYVKRLGRYLPITIHELRSEAALLELVGKERSRPVLVLLDSPGKQMSSEQLAEFLRRYQEGGTQTLMFAVGPADGWAANTRNAAAQCLSLSRMTLAHEIARVVLLEQLYRACTILAGHPYHLGH
jgi:23S rRNA (pseudouridine1915-N3)-methyltransferase